MASSGSKRSTLALSIVEKVLSLQGVDIFSEVPSEALAYMAAIAKECRVEPEQSLFRENDPSDSMFLVLEGKVRLHREDSDVLMAGPGQAFGTWALFDDEPRVVTATAIDRSELLQINKADFLDLLADNVEVTQNVLRALARRLRGLGRVVHTRQRT